MVNPINQNALLDLAMKAWDSTKQPLRSRATLLPLGEYEDGSVHPAWPGLLAAPFEGMANFGRLGYDSPEAIEDNARSAFDIAGGAMTGSLGVGLAGGLVDNAVGSAGARLTGSTPDLPMDLASRMARAREMGFDTDVTYYRGAHQFDDLSGPTWVAEDPDYAAVFPLGSNMNTAVAPLHLRRGKLLDMTQYPAGHSFTVDEFKQAAGIRHRRADDALTSIEHPDFGFEAFQAFDLPEVQDHIRGYYSGARVNQHAMGGEGVGVLVLDPTDLRSVNAAFDPAMSDSANLLAANAKSGAAVPLGLEAQDDLTTGDMNFNVADANATWNPMYDYILGGYDPMSGGKAHIHDSTRQEQGRDVGPYVQHQLTNAAPRVWPSERWWSDHGVTDTGWMDRLGSLQSAGYSFLNGLGFGLPDAILANVAPDAKEYIDGMRHTHSGSGAQTAAEVAGFVASPGQKVLRSAGDAVLSRTGSKWAAGTADAATAGAVASVPNIIEGDGMPISLDDVMLTALGTRLAMPHLSSSVAERAKAGALGGAFSAAPGVALEGDLLELAQIPFGALSAAALRGSTKGKDTRDPEFIDQLGDAYAYLGIPGVISLAYQIANTVRDEPTDGQGMPGTQSGPSDEDLMSVLRSYGLIQ